jgi:menaquinone-dependent protoporphyrinogen oxidase
MAKYLVVYTSSHGQTRKVAEFIAKTLKENDAKAELVDIKPAKGKLDTTGVKAVFLGSFVHAGKYPGNMIRFTAQNLKALASVPVNFFTVCLAARGTGRESKKTMEGYSVNFASATGLKPATIGYVAGALPYTRYNFLVKFILKKINESTGGDTDTSKDYEYTDWDSVRKFALAGM